MKKRGSFDWYSKEPGYGGESGVTAIGIRADVSKVEDVNHFVAEIEKVFGGADFLINNAGTGSEETILNSSDEKWQYYWDLHVMAAVRLSRALSPLCNPEEVA